MEIPFQNTAKLRLAIVKQSEKNQAVLEKREEKQLVLEGRKIKATTRPKVEIFKAELSSFGFFDGKFESEKECFKPSEEDPDVERAKRLKKE